MEIDSNLCASSLQIKMEADLDVKKTMASFTSSAAALEKKEKPPNAFSEVVDEFEDDDESVEERIAIGTEDEVRRGTDG